MNHRMADGLYFSLNLFFSHFPHFLFGTCFGDTVLSIHCASRHNLCQVSSFSIFCGPQIYPHCDRDKAKTTPKAPAHPNLAGADTLNTHQKNKRLSQLGRLKHKVTLGRLRYSFDATLVLEPF